MSSSPGTTTFPSYCSQFSDKAKICVKHKKLCVKEKYRAKMQTKCPKTCCSEPKVSLKMVSECSDAAGEKCNGLEIFCQKSTYAKTMKKKCAKTCGYCQAKEQKPACLNISGDDWCYDNRRLCNWSKELVDLDSIRENSTLFVWKPALFRDYYFNRISTHERCKSSVKSNVASVRLMNFCR